MSAKDLFGVILRSFGIACILWGLDDFLRAAIVTSRGVLLLTGVQDYAGGTVIHLNVINVLKLLIGVALLVWGARLARWFYPGKP